MSRMFSRLGCTVETAVDGQAALDLLLGVDDSPPRFFDMITLDNAMCVRRCVNPLTGRPIRTGEETIRELRKAGRHDLTIGCALCHSLDRPDASVTGNALRSDQDGALRLASF